MTLTIVIPNRNRDLATVKRSLDSLAVQLHNTSHAVVVDYGSKHAYQEQLRELIETYKGITLVLCPTQGQLWNKSRCINMVLKSCSTTHFMVCDMDMLWNPDFLKIHLNQLPQDHVVYFTVGVMTQQESALQKNFHDYTVKFNTNSEATGITLFPTALLKSINGFDEFYHGWGSEDTDVHMRLKNAGVEVRFRESEVYFKHQWHAKGYRTIQSAYPFHTKLERINAYYLKQSQAMGRIMVNTLFEAGHIAVVDDIASPKAIQVQPTLQDLKASLWSMMEHPAFYEIEMCCEHNFSLKNKIKAMTKVNMPEPISLLDANDLILEWIIMNARNSFYHYAVSGSKISLTIDLR